MQREELIPPHSTTRYFSDDGNFCFSPCHSSHLFTIFAAENLTRPFHLMKPYVYHLVALFTIGVWGTTFVSTKVLLNNGLSPIDVIFYRFILAYICLWAISYRRIWAKSLKDELLLMGGALSGGSIYFLAENTALTMSYASNVSLIVCTAPLLTAIVVRLFYREYRLSTQFIIGSLIALAGVAIVVFNGHFVLNLNPLGDLLSLSAAWLWAFYSLIIKKLNGRYSTAFITRKIFFYGTISLLPLFAHEPLYFTTHLWDDPVIAGNLLFLGIIASMLCYMLWNVVLKHLGTVRASNYIYFNPVMTLLASSIVLGESLTTVFIIGAALVLGGVFIADPVAS